MPAILISFFSKPANIIGSILLICIIGLSAYTWGLRVDLKSKENIIAEDKINIQTLKTNNTTLQAGIDAQNKAVSDMNKQLTDAQADFQKKTDDLKNTNASLNTYIANHKNYVHPNGVSECDAQDSIINDRLNARNSK